MVGAFCITDNAAVVNLSASRGRTRIGLDTAGGIRLRHGNVGVADHAADRRHKERGIGNRFRRIRDNRAGIAVGHTLRFAESDQAADAVINLNVHHIVAAHDRLDVAAGEAVENGDIRNACEAADADTQFPCTRRAQRGEVTCYVTRSK